MDTQKAQGTNQGWSLTRLFYVRCQLQREDRTYVIVSPDRGQAFEVASKITGIDRLELNYWSVSDSIILLKRTILAEPAKHQAFYKTVNGVHCFLAYNVRLQFKAIPVSLFAVGSDRLDALGGVVLHYTRIPEFEVVGLFEFGIVWVDSAHYPSGVVDPGPQPDIHTHTRTHSLIKRGQSQSKHKKDSHKVYEY